MGLTTGVDDVGWRRGENMQEQPVANAVSGNYCQPRCDEPTTEVKFANGKEGTLQVIIAPLTKLTRKVGASIDQVCRPVPRNV